MVVGLLGRSKIPVHRLRELFAPILPCIDAVFP